MKKIINFGFVLMMLFGLCSCNKKNPPVVQNEVDLAQQKIIDSFNLTRENVRIVAYDHQHEYLKYIVVKYYENGMKEDETVYYFCLADYVFEREAANYASTNANIDKETRTISYKDNFADTGTYAGDLAKIKEAYFIK